MVVMRECLDGGVVVWWLRSVGCGGKNEERAVRRSNEIWEEGEKVT